MSESLYSSNGDKLEGIAAASVEEEKFKLNFDGFTIFTFVLIAISLVLASASGIGGGGILVPIYILLLGAPGKVAIPLSNITILGGGIGNNVFNLQKRHPVRDAPLIDYDTVVMLEPLTIFGAVLGSFLNKVLPDFVLIVLLATSLAYTAFRTLRKGLERWNKETLAMEEGGFGGRQELAEALTKASGDSRGNFSPLTTDDDDEKNDDDDDVGTAGVRGGGGGGGEDDEEEEDGLGGDGDLSDHRIPAKGANGAGGVGGGGEVYSSLPAAAEVGKANGGYPGQPIDTRLNGGSGGGQGAGSAFGDLPTAQRPGSSGMGGGPGGGFVSLSLGEMSEAEVCGAQLAVVEEEERRHPIGKMLYLLSCFGGVMTLDYLKEVQACGTGAYWAFSLLTLPWAAAYTLGFGKHLVRRHKLKQAIGYEFLEGDVHWDARAVVLYPLLCMLAGVLAGLFGVGGGMIKGPLVLEMGLTPLQAHASGMVMILFTAGSACVSFYLFGQLNLEVGKYLFFTGLVCTAFGQYGFDKLFKRTKRQSLVVLCMGSIISLSAVLLTFRSVLHAQELVHTGHSRDLFHMRGLCAENVT